MVDVTERQTSGLAARTTVFSFRSTAPLSGVVLSTALSAFAQFIVDTTLMWWLIRAGSGPIFFALLSICLFLPLGLGALSAGILVQRFGMRRLILISRAVSVLGVALISCLISLDLLSPVVVLVIAFFAFFLMAPAGPASLSAIPTLARLARVDLIRVNGLSGAIVSAATIGGLAAAGVLIETLGISWTLWLATALMVLSFGVSLATLPRLSFNPSRTNTVAAWRNLTREVFVDPRIGLSNWRYYAFAGLILGIPLVLQQIFLPLRLQETGGSAITLPVLLILSGLSGMLGGIVFATFARRMSQARLEAGIFMLAVLSVGLLILPASLSFLALALAFGNLAASLMGASIISQLHTSSPKKLLAHMFGVWQSAMMIFSAPLLLATGVMLPWSAPFTIAVLIGLLIQAYASSAGRRRFRLLGNAAES